MTRISETPAWTALKANYQQTKDQRLQDYFRNDPERFAKFNITLPGLVFDFSKHRITEQTLKLLIELAQAAHVSEQREQMFTGAKINHSEDRAVLHSALRNMSGTPVKVDGSDVMPAILSVQERMRDFSERVRNGSWTGHTGKPIEHIVNIGIGGSDLGPLMVCEALKPYTKAGLELHFVSNVDAADLSVTLAKCQPETTLFLIASKTFTTSETMLNAQSAREWLTQHSQNEASVSKHFVALSTNSEAVKAFGIEQMFEFWDFVGGRYSLWSAIGLSIAIAIGFDGFQQLLAGAANIDEHFRHAPLEQNIPVIMALLGIWYNNFFEAESQAILPYSKYLEHFPAYLQQAEMESNGKSITQDNQPITDYQTAPIIWGESGTNGQHAFYQLIHQGTKLIPIDFIGFVRPTPSGALGGDRWREHHDALLANMFAQAEALMQGDTPSEPYRLMPGNRPSSTLLFAELTPYNLGRLIALYEHKIFVQGVIWQINSFDQWGVELGKRLASGILSELKSQTTSSHDSSTTALIDYYLRTR